MTTSTMIRPRENPIIKFCIVLIYMLDLSFDIVFYGERLVPVLKIKRRNFNSLIPLVRTKQFFNPSQERSNPITNVKPNAP